jgi:hypothetical protein
MIGELKLLADAQGSSWRYTRDGEDAAGLIDRAINYLEQCLMEEAA